MKLFQAGRYASALTVLQPPRPRAMRRRKTRSRFSIALGLGTPRDLPAARRRFELAALQGDAAAQTSLGAIYLNG